ncbi:MAG: hypothetical protein ACM3NW_05745 [Syntrophomonadaceae bacterium]
MNALVFVAVGAAVAVALLVAVPRFLLRRAQDRLAARLLGDPAAAFRLLTRAERATAGAYRRVPGVLGLTAEAIVFFGVFGESEALPTSRIQKIVTGSRLSSGRRLAVGEVLRLTRSSGEEAEFVLERASAHAWRSHLGLWAVEERRAAMDVVSPGRK